MVATNKGYVEEMDALLEGGADVNATHKVYHYKKIGVVSHLKYNKCVYYHHALWY